MTAPSATSAASLIVGAGPTGLSLALQLATRGIDVRIIDRASGPGETSRAMGVQARTLEFYRQLGMADEIEALGTPMDLIRIRNGKRNVALIDFSEMGKGLSPFPHMLGFPQDEHERFLIGKLDRLGVSIEWQTSLENFTQDDIGIEAIIGSPAGTSTYRSPYIFGCDGSHSQVRESAGIGFPGGTYAQLFWLADVQATGKPINEMFGHIDQEAMVMMMTVRTSGTQRLVGFVPERLSGKSDIGFDDLRPMVERMLGVSISSVGWFSTYRVHHRVVDHFRANRAFLLGDAGHVHSPAGGQGMNTGIGDAVNLGWKIAQVLQSRADPALLDTYEAERIPFARKLVATTDRSFQMVVDQGVQGMLLRQWIIPRIAPIATRFAAVKRKLFRAMSQIDINYRNSALSAGSASRVYGGDRLPWVVEQGRHNFDALRSMDWQVHIYGAAQDELRDVCGRSNLDLQLFDWGATAARAGLKRDAAYLIRPDGYVACAIANQDATTLRAFIDRFDLRFVLPK